MTTAPDPAPRRSNGCLWAFLAVVALIALPFIFAGGYSAWYLHQGFRHDPVLRAVTALLRQEGLAHQVLGNDIRVTGVEASTQSFIPGLGAHIEYEVTLAGDKANGTLDVEADTSHDRVDIKSMILTLPYGGRYDLLRNVVLQRPRGETDSI